MTTDIEKRPQSAVGVWLGQRAVRRAGLSLLIPGWGQWLQRRPVAAALQFSVVILAALDATSPWSIALAVAARFFSAYEAYGHDDAAPESPTKVEP